MDLHKLAYDFHEVFNKGTHLHLAFFIGLFSAVKYHRHETSGIEYLGDNIPHVFLSNLNSLGRRRRDV